MIDHTMLNRIRRQRELTRTLVARHALLPPELDQRPAHAAQSGVPRFQPGRLLPADSLQSAPPIQPESISQHWPEPPVAPVEQEAWEDWLPGDTVEPEQAADQSINTTVNTAAPEPLLPVDDHLLPNMPPFVASAVEQQILASHKRQPAGAVPEQPSHQAVPVEEATPTPSSLADVVKRMREGWRPEPEATPTAAVPSANPIADVVRQMQSPQTSQHAQRPRPRVPMGQRLAEARDFGLQPEQSVTRIEPETVAEPPVRNIEAQAVKTAAELRTVEREEAHVEQASVFEDIEATKATAQALRAAMIVEPKVAVEPLQTLEQSPESRSIQPQASDAAQAVVSRHANQPAKPGEITQLARPSALDNAPAALASDTGEQTYEHVAQPFKPLGRTTRPGPPELVATSIRETEDGEHAGTRSTATVADVAPVTNPPHHAIQRGNNDTVSVEGTTDRGTAAAVPTSIVPMAGPAVAPKLENEERPTEVTQFIQPERDLADVPPRPPLLETRTAGDTGIEESRRPVPQSEAPVSIEAERTSVQLPHDQQHTLPNESASVRPNPSPALQPAPIIEERVARKRPVSPAPVRAAHHQPPSIAATPPETITPDNVVATPPEQVDAEHAADVARWAARLQRHHRAVAGAPEARGPEASFASSTEVSTSPIPESAQVSDGADDVQPGSPAAWARRIQQHNRGIADAERRGTAAPSATDSRTVQSRAGAPSTVETRVAQRGDAEPISAKPTIAQTQATQIHHRQVLEQQNQGIRRGQQRSVEEPQPLPMRESTRRFLQPIVGFDPRDVPVQRGVAADEVATQYRADALTDGHEVVLSSRAMDDSPQALALLAHELTHVARPAPRFVPPVGAAEPEVVRDASEEHAAQAAEMRSAQRARQANDQALHGQRKDREQGTGGRSPEQHALIEPVEQPFSAPTSGPNDRWNGLPAPWEPLPTFDMPSSVPSVVQVAPPVARVPAPSAHTTASPTSPSNMPVAAPPIQRAETGRVEANESASGEPVRPDPISAPEPDLDALARQVYGMLKQRLATERRRMGS